MKKILLALCLVFSFQAISQDLSLRSGPMLGYCEMREVMIWAQTHASSKICIVYRNSEGEEWRRTENQKTIATKAFTSHHLIDSLEPGTTYNYYVLLDDSIKVESEAFYFTTQSLFQFRTDPPEFSFAIGSCNYVNEEKYDRPGKPYGQGLSVFPSILEKQPDFMIWLGDNTYLREADFYSRMGIYHRHTHTREASVMQSLLAGTHHYAIWDDHDYGPNNSDKTFRNKEITLEAFQDFWANPGYGEKKNPGVYGKFTWADIDFFLLDNRYHRDPNAFASNDQASILGEKQKNWLLMSLLSSKSPFKVICMGGQFLNTSRSHENYARFEKEREEILNFINEHKIKGVIFLTGDRHHSALAHYQKKKKIPVYDFTVSPLSAKSYAPYEKNEWLIPSTVYSKQNFAIIKVSGKRGERMLRLELFDLEGKSLWFQNIKESDFKPYKP